MNILLSYHICDVIKRMRKYAWSDVSRSSIRFTYSSVARHIGPCICHNSQTYTWNDVIPYKGRTIHVFSSSVGATAPCGLWSVGQYLPIFPYLSPTLSPSSYSQRLKISFYFFSPSFPGFSSSYRLFQFLSEYLFGHPILLHSL